MNQLLDKGTTKILQSVLMLLIALGVAAWLCLETYDVNGARLFTIAFLILITFSTAVGLLVVALGKDR